MQLSYEDILEYKRLHYKHFGEKLTDDEAWILAHNMIHFFSLITEIPPANGKSSPLEEPPQEQTKS